MKRVHGWLSSALCAALMLLCAPGCSKEEEPGGKHGFGVSDSSARGCEVLLTEGTAKIAKVTFDDSVVGTFVREAPRVAISFVSKTNAAIATGAVQLSVAGDAAQVQVKKVNCVGAKAEPLAGATVSLQ